MFGQNPIRCPLEDLADARCIAEWQSAIQTGPSAAAGVLVGSIKIVPGEHHPPTVDFDLDRHGKFGLPRLVLDLEFVFPPVDRLSSLQSTIDPNGAGIDIGRVNSIWRGHDVGNPIEHPDLWSRFVGKANTPV